MVAARTSRHADEESQALHHPQLTRREEVRMANACVMAGATKSSRVWMLLLSRAGRGCDVTAGRSRPGRKTLTLGRSSHFGIVAWPTISSNASRNRLLGLLPVDVLA